ncbi:MAG: serine protease [Actinomycetota bacterium]|nr:serine protease [Actinomycetota bacterium]
MGRFLDRLSMTQAWALGVTIALVTAAGAVPVYALLIRSSYPESILAWELAHPGDGLDRMVVDLDLSRVEVSVVPRPPAAPSTVAVTSTAATRGDRLAAALSALRRVKGVRFAVEGSGDQALVAAEPGTGLSIASFVTDVRRQTTARTLDLTDLPDDPFLSYAWNLRNDGSGTPLSLPARAGADINALRAWERTRGAGSVIAVVDTGADLAVPEIASGIWTNPDEPCGSVIDLDGDGLVGDCHGWNFYLNSPDVTNTINGTKGSRHGTMVAGSAAAAVGNRTGAGGAAPEAVIMPLVAGYDRTVHVPAAARAVRYATDHGADVINLSFGGVRNTPAPDDLTLRDAIRYAGDHDVLVVVAAGNDGADREAAPMYPASFREPNMLVVGASAADDSVSSFSAYGDATVDLFAPGTSLPVPDVGGDTVTASGTSFSSPIVAATVAMMRSVNPASPVAVLRERLLDGTIPKAAFAGRSVSGGRLDAGNAVAAMPEPVRVTFEGLSGLASSTPVRASATLAGSGENLPTGPLQVRLDLLARSGGTTFTVGGATIDAGDAGTATTDAAGAVVLTPPGLTAARLRGGVTVPLGFTLPQGRYGVAVRLVSEGLPVTAAQFGVFDVTDGGSPVVSPSSGNEGGGGAPQPPASPPSATAAPTVPVPTVPVPTAAPTIPPAVTPTGPAPTAAPTLPAPTSAPTSAPAGALPSPRLDYPGGTPLWGITYLAPPSASVSGNGELTIAGTRLPEGAFVQVGAVFATTLPHTADRIVVRIPPSAFTGAVDVVVWAPDWRSEVLRAAFTYTGATPGPPATAPATRSSAGGSTATTAPPPGGGAAPTSGGPVTGPTSVAPTRPGPTVAPPAPAPGSGTARPSFSSTRPSLSSTGAVPGPTPAPVTGPAPGPGTNPGDGSIGGVWGIASIVPAAGGVAGGTTVTIMGTRLPNGATVQFGGVAARTVQQVGDLLIVVTPPGVSAGPVDVTVWSSDGRRGSLESAFTYVDTQAGSPSGSAPGSTRTETPPGDGNPPGADPGAPGPSPSATVPGGQSPSEPGSGDGPGAGDPGGDSGGGDPGGGDPGSGPGSGAGITLTPARAGTPSLASWMWAAGTCPSTCRAIRG